MRTHLKNVVGVLIVLTVLFRVSSILAQDTCSVPVGTFKSFTQGGWGNTCHGTNPGCVRDTWFSTVYPTGLTVGGIYTIHFSTATAVRNFLPAGGTARHLTANLTNPTVTPAGVFAGQVTALALNVGFSNAGITGFNANLGDLFLSFGPLAGYSVNQVLALCNAVLGGDTAALPADVTIPNLNDAADHINKNFDGGTVSRGSLCLNPPCPVSPPLLVHVQDRFCLTLCGNPVKIYWCCPRDGMPVFTWQPGCADCVERCHNECTPYVGTVQWDARADSVSAECNGMWWSATFSGEVGLAGCICVSFDRQLPVELQNFAAVSGDRRVSLQWATASELNNDHFEIIRDGRMLARVDGAVNSTSERRYSWADNTDLSNGVTYSYSLVTVSTNGARAEIATQSATPHSDVVPAEFALEQNYPNPFNPTTTISFTLPEAGTAHLTVFDLTGRQIALLVNGNLSAGTHRVDFDGSALPSGIYYYRLEADGQAAVRKLVLMK
jgi:hypothetical protein